ncbi:hypothetical protein D9M68_619090 [compost metagenome]
MAHVARTEVGIDRLLRVRHALLAQRLGQEAEQLVQGAAAAYRHVVDLIAAFRRRHGRQDIGLHRVFHEAEVAAGLAVAVDGDVFALDHSGGPLGNHRRVGAVGILPLAEHVEIPQAHGLEAIGAREHVRVQLVDVLGHRVRRQGLADVLFDLGQRGMVAVGGAGGRIHERLHFGIARRDQHVQEPADIHLVGGDRVLQRARHRAQRRLMQHEVGALHGAAAGFQVADIAFNEGKARPFLGRDRTADFVQVALVAGGEIVQAGDGLAQFQQGLQQVRADEAGAAGHQPLAGSRRQFLLDGFKTRSHSLPYRRRSDSAGDSTYFRSYRM